MAVVSVLASGKPLDIHDDALVTLLRLLCQVPRPSLVVVGESNATDPSQLEQDFFFGLPSENVGPAIADCDALVKALMDAVLLVVTTKLNSNDKVPTVLAKMLCGTQLQAFDVAAVNAIDDFLKDPKSKLVCDQAFIIAKVAKTSCDVFGKDLVVSAGIEPVPRAVIIKMDDVSILCSVLRHFVSLHSLYHAVTAFDKKKGSLCVPANISSYNSCRHSFKAVQESELTARRDTAFLEKASDLMFGDDNEVFKGLLKTFVQKYLECAKTEVADLAKLVPESEDGLSEVEKYIDSTDTIDASKILPMLQSKEGKKMFNKYAKMEAFITPNKAPTSLMSEDEVKKYEDMFKSTQRVREILACNTMVVALFQPLPAATDRKTIVKQVLSDKIMPLQATLSSKIQALIEKL